MSHRGMRSKAHGIKQSGQRSQQTLTLPRLRRTARFQRRLRTGQSLVIFALSFTVLLGLAGLTIDVARAYDLYARMQRAAEAGALAGVMYMPNYYNAVRPGDVDSAVSRASKEVVKNGFGSVLAPNAPACVNGAEVSICPVAGKSYDLVVTVRETLNLVLLSGLGVQPITLTVSGQAEYLPPIQIGGRSNAFGDAVECYDNPNNPDPTQTYSCNPGNAANLQPFLATINGPSELKENGDPYVYCEEGPAYTNTPDSATLYTAYNGDVTNHPQYTDSITNHCGQPNTGVQPGNPDQQPNGYTGEATKNTAHPSAYNYLITVPSGVGNATIWVYNPSFIPDGGSLLFGGGTFDRFNSGGTLDLTYFKGPGGNGIKLVLDVASGGIADAPPFYFTTTYSLYSVGALYDRGGDSLVGSQSYPPYDALPLDLTAHGCSLSNQVYDPYWNGSSTANLYNLPFTPASGNGCFPLTKGSTATPGSPYEKNAPNPCWQAWCPLPIGIGIAPGQYRLAIETTGLASQTAFYSSDSTSGYGSHSYALKVCPATSVSPIGCPSGATAGNPGLQIAAWNNADMVFSSSGLSQNPPNPNNPSTTCAATASPGVPYSCLDLGCIQTAYAGRTVNVSVFDPGDGSSGSIYTGVVEANVGSGNVTYPFLSPSYLTTIDGDSVVQAENGNQGYNAFNGLWLTARITLPPGYTGNCQSGASGTGWWQLIYAGNGFVAHDQLAVSFSLTGSPVHLVPVG